MAKKMIPTTTITARNRIPKMPPQVPRQPPMHPLTVSAMACCSDFGAPGLRLDIQTGSSPITPRKTKMARITPAMTQKAVQLP
jgi:hypothetical protein